MKRHSYGKPYKTGHKSVSGRNSSPRLQTQKAAQSVSGGAKKTSTPPEPKSVINGEILIHGYMKKGGVRVKAHTRAATPSQSLKRSEFVQTRGSTKRGRPAGSKKGRR